MEKIQKSEVGVTLVDRGANRGIYSYFSSVFLVCCAVLLSFLRADEFIRMNGITSLTL